MSHAMFLVTGVFWLCLCQWEDLSTEHAFTLNNRYKSVLPSYNDDIEGTASVTVAGVLVKHCRSLAQLFQAVTVSFLGRIFRL